MEEVNKNLAESNIINLDNYPNLFVVHFRGTHFFTDFFNQEQRREYRDKIKSKEIIEDLNSPAVYELTSTSFGKVINGTIIEKAQIKVRDELLDLEKTPSGKFWVSNKTHDNLLYQHYHRYVNNYEEFRAESIDKAHECYKKLTTTKNPYISTTDNAMHAIYYALGMKTTASAALRPTYDENLRAKHPKVGYIQVIIHSLQDIINQHPLFLSSLHASNKIDIKCRTLYERETTFLSSIPAQNIIDTITIRFPSFESEYKSYYKEKYGLDKKSYNNFKKSLTANHKSTSLVEKIAEHYASYLNSIAHETIKKFGGYLINIGLDGRLSLNHISNFEISDVRKKKLEFDIYSTLNLFSSSKQNLKESLLKSSDIIGTKPVEMVIPNGFHDVSADGSCFYHAISYLLNDGRTAEDLRSTAIDHILNNIELYKDFLIDENPNLNLASMNPIEAITAYINHHISEEGNSWADHLMIQALANSLGARIEVHMFNLDGNPQIHQQGERLGENIILTFNPLQVGNLQPLIIGNIANLHFVAQESNSSETSESDSNTNSFYFTYESEENSTDSNEQIPNIKEDGFIGLENIFNLWTI